MSAIHKAIHNKTYILLVVVAVLFIGIGVLGSVTHRFALAVMPDTQARVITTVCTQADIEAFNKQYYDESLQKVIDTIVSRPRYTSDPSCVFMAYSYFFNTFQYTKARESAAQLEALVQAGHFVDNRIDRVQGIATIKEHIKVVEGMKDGGSDE